ncbi:efflux RND transporter periplasmic adaptor subunit [Bosea sp. CS1GBMeth4]|uniref:efflux RND transporter periplasmic adaptor subunit n=1 Tax=Bosea sp. CS1GBMeth4 TaxID=1892849 RepID=UPI00164624ED|nr:efflux RND transporter periplasmic adaptor subunit [Bosea sp. CS1GBMeth4]
MARPRQRCAETADETLRRHSPRGGCRRPRRLSRDQAAGRPAAGPGRTARRGAGDPGHDHPRGARRSAGHAPFDRLRRAGGDRRGQVPARRRHRRAARQGGPGGQAGRPALHLDDRELRAQVARDEANVERDKATLAQKRADLARQKSLVDKGAGTQQAFDQATADEAVAAAAIKADEATLALDRVRLGYTRITAPISGRLGAITATPGNAVRANDASANLVTVTELAPIRVAFTLPERDLALLRTAAAAQNPARVTAFASGTHEELGTGDLSFIDSAVDIPSGTVGVKALFTNEPHRLWPGEYVDVVVALGTLPAALTIPSVALQEGQKGPFVYVVAPDGTVEARPVKVASNENGVAALASGLSQDEKVVTEGQSRLAPGARVRLAGQQTASP